MPEWIDQYKAKKVREDMAQRKIIYGDSVSYRHMCRFESGFFFRQPAALPGWLATTTRRECLRILRVARRQDHVDLPPEGEMPSDPNVTMIEQEIIVAERDAALRAAFAELPPGCHELLSMLMSDPPCAYTDISATLGIPVGSIGPTRARCLNRLRRSPHLTAVLGEPERSIEVKGTGRWA